MHVVSTAGHVDHGKSTLIERLTGIDPDRLAEEKARGLTIDLGFAWLTLPSGREIGIVDVPGHERFIHNMLAGVGSVDASIFVVDAREGWMPQSEEHLAILDLLGARGAVVALTKRDLVDDSTLERARGAVAGRLAGTTLDGSEIVAVSAVTGQGIDQLRAAIDRMIDAIDAPADRGRPRVFVDRSFSIKGAGTVVTGTLTGGTLRVDDAVEILPSGKRARIRSIQTHKTKREIATPVSRVALNLGGVERDEIARGDAIVLAGQWRPTQELDVELRTVRTLDRALTSRGSYRAHIGTAEAMARVSITERGGLKPGTQGRARVTLAHAVVAGPGDRIVLRDIGRSETVAGGLVRDAHPSLDRGVIARADVAWLLDGADPAPDAVITHSYVIARDRFEQLSRAVIDAVAAFHSREPLAQGMPRDDARIAAGIADARLFAELLEHLPGDIATEGTIVRVTSHRVRLDAEQEAARAAVLDTLDASGMTPPSYAELTASHGERLVRALIDAGDLVKVGQDLVFSSEQLRSARDAIAKAIDSEGPLTAARLKEVLGTSRKYAIPLLEHLDATGFTRRRGDLRELTP